MDLELTGKRAFVTGGSRGIGKAVARELAREGVDVAITGRDLARLEATAAELAAESGRKIVPVQMESGDGASISAAVEVAAAALGGIDIVVNNAAQPAGRVPAPRFDGVTEEYFFDEIRVKVLGYLRVAQACVPYMIEGGSGRIINISGYAGRRVSSVVGSTRNASVVALSKNLADELAPHKIGVVTVHPGSTRTEATTPEAAERATDSLAGRIIDASEVAYVVTFLCSPKAVAVNGDTIAAAGGIAGTIYY